MTDTLPLKLTPKCPICGKPPVAPYDPFCSKRCADLDLSRWLNGVYAVPGEPVDAGLLEEESGPGKRPDPPR